MQLIPLGEILYNLKQGEKCVFAMYKKEIFLKVT
jgi:hypothetical protein